MRAAFYWRQIQPTGPADADFAASDAVVLAAARRGLGVLPVVHGTPDWAALNPGDPASPPRIPADYARLLTALVTRYGPNGSLWAEHPEVARQPIRAWQIWNEPNLTRYWNVAPWAPSYVKLLKAADKALKAADPGSKTVLAGLPNESWKAMEAIYDAGARGSFDVAALHPYTGKPEERDPDREDRPARDGAPSRREGAGVGDRAVLAGGPGQDRPARRLRDDRVGPVATGSRTACRCSPSERRAAADRARVLVHVALGRGHLRQRVRLLGPAPDAQRPVARRARADDVPAPGHAVCRAARSASATRAAAPDACTLPRRVRDDGGYRAVLAERPIRRLLFASLSGRVAFSMLPLGLVLYAAAETGSTATAGALVAAFAAASALAPARGRVVDRRGRRRWSASRWPAPPRCWRWWARPRSTRPARRARAPGGLAGLSAPPLGPFTRSVWGLALRERGSASSAPTRSTPRARRRR